jgi:hypothetical protein
VIEQERVTALPRTQLALFTTGCAARVSPLMDAFGTVHERRTYHACIEALWAADGQVDADTIAALDREIRALVYPACPSDAGNLFWLVDTALAVDPKYTINAAWDQWERIDHRNGSAEWVAREDAAQEESLAILAQYPPAEARERIRRLSHAGAALDAATRAAGGSPAEVVPIPPLTPRRRHTSCTHPRVDTKPDTIDTKPVPVPIAAVRAGDVLFVSRRFTEHQVDSVRHSEVCVTGGPYLPWNAFPMEPEQDPWSPYTLDPVGGTLSAGDTCRLGVPPTHVYALRAGIVRPRRTPNTSIATMNLLPAGRPAAGGFAEESATLDERDTLLRLDLHHRPYAFLNPGETVVDAEGRELTFAPPFLLVDESGEMRVPSWPLGSSDHGRHDDIAAVTSLGCHDEVLDQWEAAIGVVLPPDEDHRLWFEPPTQEEYRAGTLLR